MKHSSPSSGGNGERARGRIRRSSVSASPSQSLSHSKKAQLRAPSEVKEQNPFLSAPYRCRELARGAEEGIRSIFLKGDMYVFFLEWEDLDSYLHTCGFMLAVRGCGESERERDRERDSEGCA